MSVVLVDLDNTLFRSERRMVEGEIGARPGAVATDGRISWMSPAQVALLDILAPRARLVPVTARSSRAFAQVRIPFPGPAVLAHGGRVHGLDGETDPAWRAHVERVSRAAAPALRDLLDWLRCFERETRSWIVEEDGLPIYLCAKPAFDTPGDDERRMADILRRMRMDLASTLKGMRLQSEGDMLAVIPDGISKRAAAAHVLTLLPEVERELVIGAGDAIGDLGFLRLAHFWMTPSGSQLDRALLGEGST